MTCFVSAIMLAPLQGAIISQFVTGDVAALNPRLMAGTPAGVLVVASVTYVRQSLTYCWRLPVPEFIAAMTHPAER